MGVWLTLWAVCSSPVGGFPRGEPTPFGCGRNVENDPSLAFRLLHSFLSMSELWPAEVIFRNYNCFHDLLLTAIRTLVTINKWISKTTLVLIALACCLSLCLWRIVRQQGPPPGPQAKSLTHSREEHFVEGFPVPLARSPMRQRQSRRTVPGTH